MKKNILYYCIFCLISSNLALAHEDWRIADICSKCALSTVTGHRGGGDPKFCPYPENSLLALQAFSVCGNHYKKKYLEFDVNSTKDGKFIVFHGPQLWKMVSLQGNSEQFLKIKIKNEEEFRKLKVAQLDSDFLIKLKLKGKGFQNIPLLDKYLMAIMGFGIKIKLVVDIKYIAPNLFEELGQKLKEFSNNYNIPVRATITRDKWRKLGRNGRKKMCKHLPILRCKFRMF